MERFESLHSIVSELKLNSSSLALFDIADLASCSYVQSDESTFLEPRHRLPVIVDDQQNFIGSIKQSPSKSLNSSGKSHNTKLPIDANFRQHSSLLGSIPQKAHNIESRYFPPEKSSPLEQTLQSDDSEFIDSSINSNGSHYTNEFNHTHPSSVFDVLTSKGEIFVVDVKETQGEQATSSAPNILTSDNYGHGNDQIYNHNSDRQSSVVILNSEPYL